jgi:nitrogen regulatory protein P-II 1
MRLVVARMKPSQVEVVRQALAAVYVTRLTVLDTQGCLRVGPTTRLVQEVLMEIAVNDDFLDRTISALCAALGGDPLEANQLSVLPMVEAVQIYRDVRGQEAL